jgi:hypothetical protein
MRTLNTNLAELLENNVAEFNGAVDLLNELNANDVTAFDKKIKLAKKVYLTYQWFKSHEGKQCFEYAGIVMTKEEFAMDVFGWKYSFFADQNRVGKVVVEDQNIVSKYKRQCTNMENSGNVTASRSIANLIKFIKAEQSGDDAQVVSTEESAEATAEATAEETTSKVIKSYIVNGQLFEDGIGVVVKLYDDAQWTIDGDADKVPQYIYDEFDADSLRIGVELGR